MIEKKIVRLLAPEENEDTIAIIDKEIDDYVEPEPIDVTETEGIDDDETNDDE